MSEGKLSPAEAAAAAAQKRLNECLDAGRNFRLEAGAGAGKTYSLVKALKRLIDEGGTSFLRRGQRVACITFTEVAREEIAREIEKHPAILVETIHAFSWAIMAQFQKPLRELIAAMEDRQEKIAVGGGLEGKPIVYDLGFFGVDAEKISLGHDDVPLLMSKLIAKPKFRAALTQSFPVIFIDEYQDTDRNIMAAISEHFFSAEEGPLIGLFGDHWQTIYRGDYGLAEFPNVEIIDKGSNFRSVPAVVNVLNKLRPELQQAVSDPDAAGEARFFHANAYAGPRTNTAHSKGDIPDPGRSIVVRKLCARLEGEGWDFDPKNTKVLMLTHNALAAEQGYPTIAEIFKRNEAFAKKEDPTMGFLIDAVEPMYRAYAEKKYGEMFRVLGGAPPLLAHADKQSWRHDMDALANLRANATVGSVLDHLKKTMRPHLPDRVSRRETDLERAGPSEVEGEESAVTRQRQLREVPYSEVIELGRFLDGNTPFATKHSVKGAEFDNVLVLLGGGWNHYNWPKLFEMLRTGVISPKDEKGYYRARNLFYVAISRPKKRLAVLATQALSPVALEAASNLFGADNLVALDT
jgi:DNA helicase-2/ATP-dependent DNA helicase PcrA